jgi:hypothetical protein
MPVTGISAESIFRARRRGDFCFPSVGAAALSFFARRVRRRLAFFSAGADSDAAVTAGGSVEGTVVDSVAGSVTGAGSFIFDAQAVRIRPATRASTRVFRFAFICVFLSFLLGKDTMSLSGEQ